MIGRVAATVGLTPQVLAALYFMRLSRGMRSDMLVCCVVTCCAAPPAAALRLQDGRTALHLSAGQGHTAVMRDLLRKGADPLLRDMVSNISRGVRVRAVRVWAPVWCVWQAPAVAATVQPLLQVTAAAAAQDCRGHTKAHGTHGANGALVELDQHLQLAHPCRHKHLISSSISMQPSVSPLQHQRSAGVVCIVCVPGWQGPTGHCPAAATACSCQPAGGGAGRTGRHTNR